MANTPEWNVSTTSSAHLDNLHPILSDQNLKIADEIIFVLRYISVAMAIPLTLCNVIIFSHKNMRNATAVYVIGLSVGQLVYITGTTTQHVCLLTFRDPLNDWSYWAVSLYFGIYCGIVARRGAYVVMSLVSVERLYAIVRPLHIRRFLLSRRPLLCMSLAYTVTATLHVYIFAKTEIRGVTVGRPSNVTVYYKPVPTQLYLRHKAVNDAFSLAAKILLTYCGLLTQISLNALTVCSLQRHNAATQKLVTTSEEAMRQRERQLTVTILAATLSYVILSLPSASHHLVYTVYPEYNGLTGRYRNVYALVQNVTFVLSVLSCCLDFVCFMVLSSNYRTTFLAVFGWKRKGEAGVSELATQLHFVVR
ncbi:hypothetical protein ACOMHN_023910 [Nucella lapillus]